MKAFEYEAVADASSAVALLSERPDAVLLGGGTNLVDLMKLGVARPTCLIDVSRLSRPDVELLDDGGLRIGSNVRNSVLAADVSVRQLFPVLSEALLAGASGQLRNMATTAGNLLQRTRCLYFQDVTKPCNKRDPGSGCPAIEGQHHNLAVLGGSDACIATHPSDMAVAMTALGAVVHVQGARGVRSIPIDDLYLLPGDDPQREYTIAHDEVITSVVVPALTFGAVSAYRKARERASYAFAIGSVAAAVDVEAGIVRDVRIGLGAVARNRGARLSPKLLCAVSRPPSKILRAPSMPSWPRPDRCATTATRCR
ncbi:MAG: Periplasmic aromatic aldehyde oxidoreductase, binding subunit YagS [Pseudonocardiales bacterium]|nr:Periplasmic aromatic aldehyde oxidoreductase, binding subunit YagS [Pseudonocardiales bacterium]